MKPLTPRSLPQVFSKFQQFFPIDCRPSRVRDLQRFTVSKPLNSGVVCYPFAVRRASSRSRTP
jgi:hypothetical protein